MEEKSTEKENKPTSIRDSVSAFFEKTYDKVLSIIKTVSNSSQKSIIFQKYKNQIFLLDKINSSYIRNKLFDYIKDENFLYKFIKYSKKAQNLLEINLTKFKDIYFNHFDLDVSKYLSEFKLFDNYPANYTENNLKNKLEEDIKKFNVDIDIFQNYIINYYNKYANDQKINDENNFDIDELPIDIFSPFIELFLKNELFKKFLTIPVVFDFIKKHNLIQNYINFFEKLNNSKLLYNSFYFIFKDIKDIDKIKDLKIHFIEIKRLLIIIENEDRLPEVIYEDLFDKFNLNKIENNLTHLTLKGNFDVKSNNIFENINNFKYLKYLVLVDINFDSIFTIDVNSLQFLGLENCKNVTISQKCANKIKKLNLIYNDFVKMDISIQFPEVEKFIYKYLGKLAQIGNIIDLNSMKKIKELFIDLDNSYFKFNDFEKLPIEELTLYSVMNDNDKSIKKALNAILKLKKIKTLCIALTEYNDEILLDLKDKNISLENLEMKWLSFSNTNIIYNLQNKFPNLSYIKTSELSSGNKATIDIEEKKDSKVKRINISAKGRNNKLYIQSYENLVDVEFNFETYYHNKNGFPLFDEKCKYNLKSLTDLKLCFNDETELQLINNLFNNFGKIPNMKKFKLFSVCKDIKQKCYENYIKKLLGLKLESIELNIRKSKKTKNDEKYYSDNELIKIDRNYNFKKYSKILINKID